MSLEDLVGTTYGPFSARISAEQVAAYVAVTGDDRARWVEHAPPSYAGALLFVVAPSFLNDAPVRRYTKLLVHVEQTFTWHRALEVEEKVTADGVLARVRTRGGVSFATFRSTVRSAEGVIIDASSTFLMGEGEPAQQAAEELEPPVAERGGYDTLPGNFSLGGGPTIAVARSASRLDLVRYAAASGDFNPVHFDHATATRAGFAGVLVHGLLMGAWLLQVAAAHSSRPDPVAEAKLRFKNAFRPGAEASVSGEIREVTNDAGSLRLSLANGKTEYVQGSIDIRTA